MSVVIAEQMPLVTAEHRREVIALYDRGLYLQAYRLAESRAPLKDWRGADARILAGRLAGNLGSQRLGNWHHIHAYRQDPTHAEACWYYGNYLANCRGPLTSWRFLRQVGTLEGAPIELRAPWLALHATVLGRLRDFDAAEEWLARAEALGYVHPWIVLERAALCTLEDRSDEAERLARKALEIRPWYRPAVQWVAHFLVEKERDPEAMELLEEAGRRLESCAIWGQLATLQMELKRYADAHASLAEFDRLAPLVDKDMAQWLDARRSDVAYFLGDFAQARDCARKVKGGFYEQIVKRLDDPPADTRRTVLPVGFVRQHHHTCAPATLASLCRFWAMPGEHLELAAALSYAGTPHHSERRWAEQNGWVVREFTVTWEAAVAVLDHGLPFTLTTTEPSSSHLQACIGYDARRGTLIVRDPSLRNQGEFLADGLFERYKSTGPRGKVLVPVREAGRLDGLELPDVALYDQLYALEIALEKHQRQDAEVAFRAMERVHADHPLTLHARRTLAHYDGNPTEILGSVEQLLRHFPDDIALLLARASCLSQMSRREEYLAILKQLAERTPTDPVCWQRYGYEVGMDAREHVQALYLLKRAMRGNPGNAGNYCNLAHIRWAQRRFDEATELYRFAFCIDDTDENLARSYFAAARSQGRSEDALDMMRKRFERFGARSWHPARMLAGALAQLERLSEGFAVLDRAMALRPDDGDLVLYVAETCIHHGDFQRSSELLEKAKGRSQPTAWLRTAANLASCQGEAARACALWGQVLEVEPLAEDAHRAYATLLADTQGRPAALRHLQETCGRFEHNFALNRLWMEWLRDEGAEAVEPVLRRLIEIHPADAWARRELGWHFLDLGRMEEAEAAAAIAADLEPNAASLHQLRGQILMRQGKTAEAREAFRQAIRISVDYEHAVRELFHACETHAERRDALHFVHQELLRQVIFGEGLLVFRETALWALEPDELLAILRQALEARRDLWHAWAALVRQLADMNQLDEAHVQAKQAVERFPLLPALWLDLAQVCRRRDDSGGEVEALNRALEINPSWTVALRQLADAYERHGQLDRAEELVRRAVARAPLVAVNHIELAEVLWRKGAREPALEQARHAFTLEPGLDQAWDRLCEWATKLERLQLPVDAARQLAERRPGEARSWLRLAQACARLPRAADPTEEKRRIDECLAAFDRAIALNPRHVDFYDQKAMALAQAGRWDEAIAVCRPPLWGEQPPLTLRGRAAWLEAQQQRIDRAIEQMHAVIAQDPKYYWGWTQLADWCQATGRWTEYLRAAEEMCKLLPHTAQPLAYRGEARLRSGDRAGGMADLRAALKLSPEYALAGFVLFDEELAAGDLDAAESALDHLVRNVDGELVTARAVRLRARQDRADDASAALQRLCHSHEQGTWPLDAAAGAMVDAGWIETLQGTLRDAIRTGDWHPHVATVWAERFDADVDTDLEERLDALDRAHARQPAEYGALDLKADLLVRAGRFDDAAAVASAAEDNPDFAVRARGRHAWIEKQRGRIDDAIEQMSRIVADDPNYYWGWTQLAEWYEAERRPADHLRAAQRLVELAPNNALAFAHRGSAHRNLGDRAEAKEDYATAVSLASGYEFVVSQLFELRLDDLEHLQAMEMLGQMEGHIDPQQVSLRKTQLMARINSARLGGEITRLLDEETVAVPRLIGICDDLIRVRQGRWIGIVVDRCEASLRADPWAWGQVGRVLNQIHDDAGAAAWMRDWAEREKPASWMLLNLAMSLRGLNRLDEAWQVHQHALEHAEPDYTRAYHELWLALDDALAGDLEAVQDFFASADLGGLDPYHRSIATYGQALLGTLTASDKARALDDARHQLAESARTSEPLDHDSALRATYRRVVAQIAANCGGLKARLWAWWRGMLPVLPAAKAEE